MIRNRLQSLLHKHNLMLSEEGLLDQAWWEAPEQPTFTHSDFKSDHLLTTQQGLTLIDFDTCTLTDPTLHERLARANLFHVLILVKIVARRVPLYKKDWAGKPARMIERAAQVLQNQI